MVNKLLKMAVLTDMTLENFNLWSSNALRIDKSRRKNNINGNFDELSAISGHLVTLPKFGHFTTMRWTLCYRSEMFCSFQSADVLNALLKNWTRCLNNGLYI